jgi:hypothetical protein
MVRRKSNLNGSSLDLFLDTICNAFGGIMFLSILISVLAQLQGGKSESSDAPPLSKEETVQNAIQAAELEEERAQLLVIVQKLERDQLGGDESQLLAMLHSLDQAQNKLSEMVAEQSRMSSKLSDVQSAVETLREESQKVERELTNNRAALTAQEQALDDALNAREQKVQLPKAKVSNKTNILLAMRYGKLYLVTDPSQSGADNFFNEHVEKLVDDQGVRIRPRQEAGWPWSDDQSLSRLQAAIVDRRPSNFFLTIALWPDSFDSFGKFRQHIVQLGYEYELLPLGDVPSIPVGRGSTPIVQ